MPGKVTPSAFFVHSHMAANGPSSFGIVNLSKTQSFGIETGII